jgi:hypothetical protein
MDNILASAHFRNLSPVTVFLQWLGEENPGLVRKSMDNADVYEARRERKIGSTV